MKQLTSSPFLKVTAFILTVLFILMSCVGVIVIYCSITTEVYTTSENKYKEDIFKDMTFMDIKNTIYRYYETDEDISSFIPSENISYFEIKDFQTSEILTSYGEMSEDSTVYKNNFILKEQYSPENHNYNQGMILYSVGKFPTEIKDGETFISASVTLSSPLDAQDKYLFTENLIKTLYSIRYTVFPLTLLCIICAVVGFVFLMYASGRQKDTEQIRPSFGVKIPLDLFLALVAGIFILGFIILVEAGALSEPQDIVIIVIYVTAAISSALGLSMSVAARIKTNTLFKNTVIYMICRLLYRIFKKVLGFLSVIFRNMHILAKVCGIAAVFFIADFISSALLFENVIMLVVWVLFKLFELGVILLCVLMWNRLLKGASALAKGEVSHKIDTSGLILDFKSHGEALNSIAGGMKTAVDERLKSERIKTELITNVSHDIKTPLTSIINYSDLISKEPTENGKITEYSSVLLRQSEKLKRLIEDLIEASKASTGNLEVKLEEMQIDVFVNQAVAEYRDRLEKNMLNTVVSIPEHPIMIMADGRRLWRIFDNLMNNICKYSLSGTRVYISLEDTGNEAKITFKNTSRDELNISTDELFERFSRGDSSRNTDGNGLGLSIAQSLTELQGGKIAITTDGDLFKVILTFPKI